MAKLDFSAIERIINNRVKDFLPSTLGMDSSKGKKLKEIFTPAKMATELKLLLSEIKEYCEETMSKWEFNQSDERLRVLNTKGQMGWQLCSVQEYKFSERFSEDRKEYVLLFKRQIL